MMLFALLLGAGSVRPADWLWLVVIVAVVLGGFFRGWDRGRR